MLDIKFIRENPDVVKENIKKKFQDEKLPLVDKVIELDAENRAAISDNNLPLIRSPAPVPPGASSAALPWPPSDGRKAADPEFAVPLPSVCSLREGEAAPGHDPLTSCHPPPEIRWTWEDSAGARHWSR